MRYWLTSLAIVLFFAARGDAEDGKKKDPAPSKDPTVETKEPADIMGKSFDDWRKALKSNDPGDREMAMKTVLLFGMDKANEAIPDVMDQMLRHKKINIDLSVRVNGTMAMNTYFMYMRNAKKEPAAKLLAEAVVIYKMFLKDQQVIMKLRAVQGLPHLGPPARELLPEIITLSRDPTTWEVRKEAIPVMVMFAQDAKGVPDARVMLALRKSASVDEPSHLVRLVAVQGLGMLGGKDVIVDLKRVLAREKAETKEVRVMAVQSLANAGKESVLLELRRLLSDGDKDVRLTAMQSLAATGKKDALPDLRLYLDHKDKEMRMQVLTMIAALKEEIAGNDKPIMLKRLNEHLAIEPDPILKIWNLATIMTLTDIDQKHMAPIVQKVADKDLPVRMAAFQVISMGGPKSKPFALPAILDAVKDKDLNVAITAIETLVHIRAEESIPMLEALSKDAKAAPELKDAAENAIDGFELMKIREKNEKAKKTPEKK